MQSSKLIHLLKRLNSRELSRFEDYVYSPYFNKHLQIREFCSYLCQLSPNWDHPRKLEKNYIHQKLFPHQPFNPKTINRLASLSLQLLHEFLVSERLYSDEKTLAHQLLLLEELRKRKSDKDYKSALQQYYKKRAQHQEDTASDFFHKYELHNELDKLFIDKGGRQFDENLQLKNESFDIFFVIEKLRIACDMLNRNKIINSNYQLSMLDKLLPYLAEPPFKDIPAIKIYHKILLLLQEENEEAALLIYESLKASANAAAEHFSKTEMMSIYDYILNHCAKKINQGNRLYYQEMLDAYQFLIQGRYLFKNDSLAAWDYKNIVTVALRVKQYDWALEFIEQYHAQLPQLVRESVYRYNLAAYHYAVKSYGKALQNLLDIDFVDASYYIGAKAIQLKCYYVLEEYEALSSLIDAFSTYLRRHKKISSYWKQANLNFLKLASQISKLRQAQDFLNKNRYRERWQKLTERIEATSPLANKDWLEEAANGLKE